MKAFKTFEMCPISQRPSGVPLEWPWQEQSCELSEKDDLELKGFTVVSEQEYSNYLSERQGEFDTWSLQLQQASADVSRYLSRASAKDRIIAEMAAENIARVRAGTWTTQDLIGLTQDVELKNVLDDVNTLSFELAVIKVSSISNPLITPSIKASWISKLQAHFYL